jgi:hypothetical protein
MSKSSSEEALKTCEQVEKASDLKLLDCLWLWFQNYKVQTLMLGHSVQELDRSAASPQDGRTATLVTCTYMGMRTNAAKGGVQRDGA